MLIERAAIGGSRLDSQRCREAFCASAKRIVTSYSYRSTAVKIFTKRRLAVLACVAALGCSGSARLPGGKGRDTGSGNGDTRDASAQTGDGSWIVPMPDASLGNNTVDDNLVVTPGDGTLTLDALSPQPIAFTATLPDGSASVLSVRWTIAHKNVGEIDPDTGVFTPNGAGGKVAVTARSGSQARTVTVSIVVTGSVEGDPDADGMPEGAGGIGGVGGDGGGTQIDDAALRAVLDKQAAADAKLVWLYPYDGTVWPRGLPAPLVQWSQGEHAAEAIKLHLEVPDAFRVDVYLGRPKSLAADKPFVRVPVPQTVWRNALMSGGKLEATLTIAARDASGALSSHIAQHNPTWKIAPTTLRGTLYYNSYATKLAENYDGAVGGFGRFGGATLALRGDSFDPVLIAGSTTPDESGCRVCHTVSANGSTLIAQRANNRSSSRYDLTSGNAETMYPDQDNGKFGWSALSPDGALALGASGPPGTQPVASLTTSALYKVSDGSVLSAPGLSELATQAATPTFSLDETKVAFNLFSGPGSASLAADGSNLVVMDFAKVDDTTYSFTNPRAVFTASQAGQYPGWPYFLPDGKGLVFELELKHGGQDRIFTTVQGARGELWWTDLEGHAHALSRANGTGYLPKGPLGHDDDATLQYEPTVAPIIAGGYAWMVFTSRRLYGNVATRAPFDSDPRGFDLTPGNPAGPTPKKLWVSAIDMPPKPDSDPSHPAFYMPAQELFAGNMRGFWALDACKPDLAECTGGDECCNGYCRRDVENLTGVCQDIPNDQCAMEYDRCNVNADCCKPGSSELYCIANRCVALVNPG
jgi:hypothetical protein